MNGKNYVLKTEFGLDNAGLELAIQKLCYVYTASMYSVCSIHALELEEIRDTIDETGTGKERIEAREIDMIDDDLDYVMHASDAANNASMKHNIT